MGKERQRRKQEEIRSAILATAREIIAAEGVEGLSIRKITNTLDYSPAIIYHYFQNKNEIVETLVGDGYRQILASVAAVEPNAAEPEKEMQEAFRRYIRAALDAPEVYKAFMLNNDPAVLRRTGLLAAGTAERSPTLGVLRDNIRRGIKLGRYAPRDPELTAQVIWVATFGLIIRLIVEKDIPPEQADRLIDQHFALLLEGLLSRGEKQ